MKRNTEREEERDRFARMVAASGVSNADFHAALRQFDEESEQDLEGQLDAGASEDLDRPV